MSTILEQRIDREIYEAEEHAKSLDREGLLSLLRDIIRERETTVANLRSALEIADRDKLQLRRDQIDKARAMLERLEAMR